MGRPLLDEEFFNELKERLRTLTATLIPAPGIALIVFTILLFMILLQQFILILVSNK